ncbi:unnamed protein product [Callosobruchus maculatus]|uniref:XPG N-terminal domain-containing protein n=1 Tax=Callosobruchus maculatus TaxID=64391 RepID=A0A653BNJ0_CALMS|nr:unnamed protein product [Callosobruchus maculatus]
MGFPGLTTFIENNAMLYLQNYQLHDTSLVIDGCATACYLYRLCKSNMCFGGDYDQYGKSIKDFFKILSDCNITPYVIFDGGNESGELKITIERMRKRIELTQQPNTNLNIVPQTAVFTWVLDLHNSPFIYYLLLMLL